MNAATTTENNTNNLSSIYMLSCCADTTVLYSEGGDSNANAKSGLLGDDDHDETGNDQQHSHHVADVAQGMMRGGREGFHKANNATTSSNAAWPITTPRKAKDSDMNPPHTVPCRENYMNNLATTKPFASNPLIYRDDENDSLWGDQSSGFFSLLASDTVEHNEESNTSVAAGNAPVYAYCTPNRNDYRQQQQQQQTRNRSVSCTALGQLNALSSPTMSAVADPLPMIELSLAKQVANMAQMTNGNLRKTNREMLRGYRPLDHRASSSSCCRTPNNNKNSMIGPYSTSPSKRTRENTGIGGSSSAGIGSVESIPGSIHNYKKLAATANSSSCNASLLSTEIVDNNNSSPPCYYYYMEYTKAPSTPIWSKVNKVSSSTIDNNPSNANDIDSEVLLTYKYPRLFLQDPTNVIFERRINEKYNNTDEKKTNHHGLWWFHVARQMETTVKHVKEDYWRSMLLHHERNVGGSEGVTPFSPSKTPTNVWSEPCASTMFIRGKTYSRDGIKVESETSIFSVLGVDSFVSSGGKSIGEGLDSSSSSQFSSTTSFLRRWNEICNAMGLHQSPFLLIINFIVPWGNFQAYLVRPDADEGPFASCKRDHPSEKAWRKFMEGNTDYRNERLKLIPRIVAGPWMVKKMVGSTPALIGTKLPVSYRGSISENYLEISLDVTKGPAFGNSVANTVVGQSSLVTVDLGFVIEGNEEDGHLPEQLLGLFRLHHLNMKKAPSQSQWIKERRC